MPEAAKEIKIYTTDCILALVDKVEHLFSENGNKITTNIHLGGQVSQCIGLVSQTNTSREDLMADNAGIALEAAIEEIVKGSEVFIDGAKIVVASEEEQEEFREKQIMALNGDVPQ